MFFRPQHTLFYAQFLAIFGVFTPVKKINAICLWPENCDYKLRVKLRLLCYVQKVTVEDNRSPVNFLEFLLQTQMSAYNASRLDCLPGPGD